MRRSLAWLILFTMLLAACGGSRHPDHEQVSPNERIVIKFSHVVAENTPKGLAARRFAAIMKERTGGRVEVQVFPNSQLYGDGEEVSRLRSNDVQMIAPSLSNLSDWDPLWQVFDLPYLFDDEQGVDRVVTGSTGQQLYAGLRRLDMEPIAFWQNGFKHFTNSRGSLLLPDQFKGLRFRTQPSPVMRDALRLLGAESSYRTFDAIYTALASRELDGQENTPSNMYSKRIYEVQPYMTLSSHGYLGYVVLVNATFWNSLPPDLRETMREAMADTTQWVRENAARLNAEALERIEAGGKVIIHRQTVNEREFWRQAMEPAYRLAGERVGADAVARVIREARGE
ncbi:MAG TPA: DctP family TRAP transporter solute-binding subunit [Symbiobacteriaceae bacterium]|jgi:C4-dicarboxylate-binding protein DctP